MDGVADAGFRSREYNSHDLIITFIDGYKYRLSHLTLDPYCGVSNEDAWEQIIAESKDCLNPPDNYRQVIKDKLVAFHILYKCGEIYVINYGSEDVQSIFDEYNEYFIYQK